MSEDSILSCDDSGRFEQLCIEMTTANRKKTFREKICDFAIKFFNIQREIYHILSSVARQYKCQLSLNSNNPDFISFEVSGSNVAGFCSECKAIAERFDFIYVQNDKQVNLMKQDFFRPESVYAKTVFDLQIVAKDFNYKFIVRPSSDVVGIGGRAI